MPVIRTERMKVRELIDLVRGEEPLPADWQTRLCVPDDVRLVVMPHAQSYGADDLITFRFWDGEDARVGMSFERQLEVSAREARESATEEQQLELEARFRVERAKTHPEESGLDWDRRVLARCLQIEREAQKREEKALVASDLGWGESGDSAGFEVSGPGGWKGRCV